MWNVLKFSRLIVIVLLMILVVACSRGGDSGSAPSTRVQIVAVAEKFLRAFETGDPWMYEGVLDPAVKMIDGTSTSYFGRKEVVDMLLRLRGAMETIHRLYLHPMEPLIQDGHASITGELFIEADFYQNGDTERDVRAESWALQFWHTAEGWRIWYISRWSSPPINEP